MSRGQRKKPTLKMSEWKEWEEYRKKCEEND
jgi:hypothetical protein